MLTENEWNMINNILLELYTLKEIDVLIKKVFNVLRILIPFSKGFFISLDENQEIQASDSYFLGFDEKIYDKYINDFYTLDYLKYLYDFCQETSVFQDSAILADEIRKKNDFYRKFLLPSDIPYGAGILLIKNRKIIGVFNFFRSTVLGDFSQKDIYILNLLKRHIENLIYSNINDATQKIFMDESWEEIKKTYNFSDREAEILQLIAEGKSNADICDILYVSLSTVKKHVYNIFNKAGVNSRTQLLSLIYSS